MTSDLTSLFAIRAMPSCLTDLLLIFLISLTIRSGKTQRESQLFTVICVLFLAHHLLNIFMDLLQPATALLYLLRTVHSATIFLLPVSVHYIHRTLNLPHTRKVVPVLYGATVLMLAFVFSDHYVTMKEGVPVAGPLLFCFLFTSLAFVIVYTLLLLNLLRRPDYPDTMKCLFIIIGLGPTCLLTLWDSLPLFGIPSAFLGGVVFIPMGIYTYGILRHGILDNTGWFSMGYIPNFLTTLVWLPLVLSVFLYAITRDTLFYTDIPARLFPRGIPFIISILVCFGLAIFCFQEGTRKVQTLVFGGMCALWGLLNLDMILLMLLKDRAVALQISRFDHFLLVMQLGFITHLFYCFAGLNKKVVYLAYATSLILVPLTQTDLYFTGMHAYSWGYFAAGGFLFYLMIVITSLSIILGSVALSRKIFSKTIENETRRSYVFFLLGFQFMGVFAIGNVPAVSGRDLFPGAAFMFVPVLLMAYGVFKYDLIKVNAYSKRRLWDGAAILFTYACYILLAVTSFTILKHIPIQEVAERWIDTGIPLLISLAVSLFFSVLSLRVGHTLTGSRLFGLICLNFALLSTAILLSSLINDAETALRIHRLFNIPMVMGTAYYAHLVVLVCQKKRVMPYVLFFYAASFCLALFTQSPLYLKGMIHYPWGYFAQGGPLFYVFALLVVLVFNFNTYVFNVTFWKYTHPKERNQLTLFAIGLAFSCFFLAGNTPAMFGYDIKPLGNYVFIPLILFGYAMFRKNMKDIMLLLNQSLYAAGIVGFLGLGSYILHKSGAIPWAWGAVFGGIICVGILFRGFDRVWLISLSLFFGRQKEMLDQLYLRLTDQLSKSRSLEDVVHFTSVPMFRELLVKTVRILFYSHDDGAYHVFERVNPYSETDIETTADQAVISGSHPLFALFHQERQVITQARVEAWIANTDTSLSPDDMLRWADIIQPVYFENTLTCLLLFQGKEDGSVYSKVEKEFISRLGLILGPYIENAKLLQGLEKKIEERTEDLRAALLVKSDFLARMSHEVRSPLNAILGMGELLGETPLTDEQARYIDILSNSSGLLLSVINDILDFSKLDSGRVTVESIPFDLYRLMNDLKNIVAASSYKKGLEVQLDIAPDVSRCVCGDPYKLSQVIINLADNAVRFTDKGSITLHVDRSRDHVVLFSVEDTGMGIARDKLSMIFERFSQAESSTTRRYGGSGLGLTISKKLVEILGGALSVTSELGVGSRFEFTAYLPATAPEEIMDQPPLNTSPFRIKSLFENGPSDILDDDPAGEKNLHVLLAEDMKTNIQVIKNYFKQQPVALDVVTDGEQAVRMFKSKPYDLVLMDIHMPNMDGYDAVKHIRLWEKQKNGNSRTPVIVLTAHKPDKTREKQLEDVDAFLMKPIRKIDLLDTVSRLVTPQKTALIPDPAPIQPVDSEFSEIIDELILEINEELITIQNSLVQGDYETASRLSHGFKGAAGNCGLSELSDLFKTLYDLITSRTRDRAEAMVPVIRNYVDQMR